MKVHTAIVRRVVGTIAVSLVISVTALAEKTFTVTSDPPGARVQFNGKDIGVTPPDRHQGQSCKRPSINLKPSKTPHKSPHSENLLEVGD